MSYPKRKHRLCFYPPATGDDLIRRLGAVDTDSVRAILGLECHPITVNSGKGAGAGDQGLGDLGPWRIRAAAAQVGEGQVAGFDGG